MHAYLAHDAIAVFEQEQCVQENYAGCTSSALCTAVAFSPTADHAWTPAAGTFTDIYAACYTCRFQRYVAFCYAAAGILCRHICRGAES